MRILGVTIQNNLRATLHVSELLKSCSRSLYALRILRSHGLPQGALQEVTTATSVARLLYAAPAWWGHTTADDRERLERMMHRMRKLDYLPTTTPSIEALVFEADKGLLHAVMRKDFHVLRSLFPPVARLPYNLRPRQHPFELPINDNKNFIPRILYANAY
jgi:hypothetical protein